MKKYLSVKYLTSVCFLLLLGAMLWGSLRPAYYAAYHQLQNLRAGTGISTSQVEYEYNDTLPHKSLYITLNGGFQRLMGIRHVNDRYRMDNGHLTYVIPRTDVTEMAENTVAFRDALGEMGIPFGYVSTLFKIDPEDPQLPLSVSDYSHENTDAFLSILAENQVPTLDLRQKEQEQGLDHYSLYYVTDHHWTAEAGFWAYTQLVGWLEDRDSSFAVDPALTSAENYDHTVYEDIFCGSAARRVGPLYAGLDDLTLITPKFDTWLYSHQPVSDAYREGSYTDTLLYFEHLTRENMLETSAYSVYMGSDQPCLMLQNASRQKDLPVKSTPKRLLILKDSSALVVAPFLALSYDEVCLIDLRAFEGSLMEFIGEYQPDQVLAVYNPGALETHNLVLYQFD